MYSSHNMPFLMKCVQGKVRVLMVLVNLVDDVRLTLMLAKKLIFDKADPPYQ